MKYTYNLPNPVRVPCNGTSIWTDSTLIAPSVKSITFEYLNDEYILLWVNHSSRRWDIYTDRGFEKGISKLVSTIVGQPVTIGFTEQGMQAPRRASMEPNKTGEKKIIQWVNKRKEVK
jgi:hypothetical protein